MPMVGSGAGAGMVGWNSPGGAEIKNVGRFVGADNGGRVGTVPGGVGGPGVGKIPLLGEKVTVYVEK